jgi:DNA-binding MarR family transcriptional regulator
MPTRSIADTYGSIPELMRVARGTYKRAVDERLAANGFEGLPNPGGYLLAYLANDEQSIPDRIEGLGIKRREFNQLVDALVLRGYITRQVDPQDGKVSLTLTDRGRAAEEVSGAACDHVDEELKCRLTGSEMAGLRRGLAVLGEIKQSLPGPAIRRGPLDDRSSLV